jgi:hypothetical protein
MGSCRFHSGGVWGKGARIGRPDRKMAATCIAIFSITGQAGGRSLAQGFGALGEKKPENGRCLGLGGEAENTT